MACAMASYESINEEFLSCTICNEVFDEVVCTPRNLVCGHTLCSPCIDKVVSSNLSHCPECRKVIDVRTSNELPICYIALRIVRNIKQQKMDEIIEEEDFSLIGNDSEKDLPDFSNSQPLKNISLRLDAIFAPSDHIKKLEERTSHCIVVVQDRIDELKVKLAENEETIKNVKSHMRGEELRINCLWDKLSQMTSAEEKIYKSVSSISDLDEVMEEILEAKVVLEETLEDEEHLYSLEHFIGETIIKSRFERCRQLYALQEQSGIKKYAHVSLCVEDKVLLHSLRALPQPDRGSIIMQYSEIHCRIPPQPSVSLYLHWSNAVQGVVQIKLNNCKHAKRFLALCTGEYGHGFLNKVLFDQDQERPSQQLTLMRSFNMRNLPRDTTGQSCGHNVQPAPAMLFVTPAQGDEGSERFVIELGKDSRGPRRHAVGRVTHGLSLLLLIEREKLHAKVAVKDCGAFVESF